MYPASQLDVDILKLVFRCLVQVDVDGAANLTSSQVKLRLEIYRTNLTVIISLLTIEQPTLPNLRAMIKLIRPMTGAPAPSCATQAPPLVTRSRLAAFVSK